MADTINSDEVECTCTGYYEVDFGYNVVLFLISQRASLYIRILLFHRAEIFVAIDPESIVTNVKSLA